MPRHVQFTAPQSPRQVVSPKKVKTLMKTVERHAFHFRGAWLPPAAFRLLAPDDGTPPRISAKELALLCMIDALTDPDGVGCFASNRYLANRLRMHPLSVARAVAKLVKVGVVRRIPTSLSSRELRVVWSEAGDRPPPLAPSANPPLAPSANHKQYGEVLKSTRCGNETSRNGVRSSTPMIEPFIEVIGHEKDESRKTKGAAPPPKQEDYGRAQKLNDVVTEKSRIRRRWSRRAWADEMARLEREVGAQRLDAALVWYALHAGEQYSPQIWSARRFRERFADVEAAAGRDAKRNPDVKITDKARNVAKRLRMSIWPKGSDAQLDAFVQVGMDNVADLWHRLKNYMGTDPKLKYLAKYALAMIEPQHTVEVWGDAVHARVARWDRWSGDLMGMAWSVNEKDVLAWGRGLAGERCDDSSQWDKLLKEVYG